MAFCKNSQRLKDINRFRQKLHLRWLTGFWIRHCYQCFTLLSYHISQYYICRFHTEAVPLSLIPSKLGQVQLSTIGLWVTIMTSKLALYFAILRTFSLAESTESWIVNHGHLGMDAIPKHLHSKLFTYTKKVCVGLKFQFCLTNFFLNLHPKVSFYA